MMTLFTSQDYKLIEFKHVVSITCPVACNIQCEFFESAAWRSGKLRVQQLVNMF